MTAPPAGFFQKPLYKRRKMRYNSKAFAQRGIAQLVEQRSPKPRAEGSNPSAPAKAPADLGGSFLFPSPVLPPSDEGGGKPEGLDGGRDRPGLLRSGMRRGRWLRVLSLSRLRRQLPRQREPSLRGATCPSKKPPCLLDKAASGCYSCVSKNGCQCKWRSSRNGV